MFKVIITLIVVGFSYSQTHFLKDGTSSVGYNLSATATKHFSSVANNLNITVYDLIDLSAGVGDHLYHFSVGTTIYNYVYLGFTIAEANLNKTASINYLYHYSEQSIFNFGLTTKFDEPNLYGVGLGYSKVFDFNLLIELNAAYLLSSTIVNSSEFAGGISIGYFFDF